MVDIATEFVIIGVLAGIHRKNGLPETIEAELGFVNPIVADGPSPVSPGCLGTGCRLGLPLWAEHRNITFDLQAVSHKVSASKNVMFREVVVNLAKAIIFSIPVRKPHA